MALTLVQQETMGLNQEALAEFIEYREEKKQNMSPRAITKAQNFLLKYTEFQQQQLVDHAIMMDWKGLYFVETKTQTSRQNSIEQDLTDRSWAQ